MLKNKRFKIIMIVGKTGAGKSTLARSISLHYGCLLLCFSDIGYKMAERSNDKLFVQSMEDEIVSKIRDFRNKGMIVVDGVSSFRVYKKLTESYDVISVFVDTDYKDRINRIMDRQLCEIEKAKIIEKEKEEKKSLVGLNVLIGCANVRIDGNAKTEKMNREAIGRINGLL